VVDILFGDFGSNPAVAEEVLAALLVYLKLFLDGEAEEGLSLL
jgi:hypothetical protein